MPYSRPARKRQTLKRITCVSLLTLAFHLLPLTGDAQAHPRTTPAVNTGHTSGLIDFVHTDLNQKRSPTQTPTHGLPEEAFNYELALSTVAELEATIATANLEIETLISNLDILRHELDFLMLNDSARSELLVESRDRARSMAIKTYIGIGAPVSPIILLDTASANDMSYRNGLMKHQTERLYEVSNTYATILLELNDQQRTKSGEINSARRQLESARNTIAYAETSLARARHWLAIAEIHKLADESFAKSRRVEPTGEQWRKLRFCESTERYAVDTGNTFYGAYQFTWETWETVYGSDNPAHAPPEEQDARARLLYSRRGSQPWPICGRFLP